MLAKEQLRKSAKEIRKTLDINEISSTILQVFQSLDSYKNAKNIAIYYPIGSELNLMDLCQDRTKSFYLPKSLESGKLSFHLYDEKQELIKDSCGIFSPNTPEIESSLLDIIIIPALMADKSGLRLGYGKGFYDKFLSSCNLNAQKVVFVPDELFVETLPAEEWDVKVDMIITQSGVWFSTSL